MSFPSYDDYKDSNIDWIGEIPEDWKVLPLHRVVRDQRRITYGIVQPGKLDETGRYMVRGQDYSTVWGKPETLFRVSDEIETPYKRSRLMAGDIVITIVGAGVGNVATIPDWLDGGNITQTTARLSIDPGNADSRFISFVLQSSIGKRCVELYSKGAAQPGLNLEHVRMFPVTVPPLPEQKAISSFLDVETSKIDGLVSEQRRLIELLKEKRQAVISHAVTKGLNPNAPMKPSGIQWLGDVPQHWEVMKLKRVIAGVESGTSVNATDEPASGEQVGVLKTSCVYTGKFDPNKNKVVVKSELDRVSCPLRLNSIIVSRMNTPDLVGAAGLVREAPANVFLPDRLWQVSFHDCEPTFVYLWTLSSLYRGQIKSVCTGTSASMKNLTQDQFGSLVFCCSPVQEQRAIAESVEREIATLGQLEAEAERAIALLQERRTALISAAVTGKIDVREFAKEEAII